MSRNEPDAVRRLIGVIPQALTSDIDLTVEENLSIYAKLYEVPRASASETSTSCSKPSTSRSGARRRPKHSPAACAAGWRSRGASSTIPASSFSTSPPPASIPSPASPYGRCSTSALPAASHHAHHHPLHGRSRPPMRPHRHRRPRKAGRPRHSHGAQGQRAGKQRRRSRLHRDSSEWQSRLEQLPASPPSSRRAAACIACSPPMARSPPCNWCRWPTV